MIVLGIETTCDETGCAIVKGGKEILSNVVASQDDIHDRYGGVFPELACRRHSEAMIPVLDEALKKAGVTLQDIDLISVAHAPGLIGALLIGLNTAKMLSLSLKKPMIGIHHVEAHLYAALMSQKEDVIFPCIGAVFSGGHTTLVKMHDIGHYELIGETIDDAIGEAFDKTAKLLGLPYPGGPHIEKIAKEGDISRFTFKAGKIKESPFSFSFSGLKTSVYYAVKGLGEAPLEHSIKCDIAASFQEAAFIDVISKTLKAAALHGCQTIVFGGGVTNSRTLREKFAAASPGYKLIWPNYGLSLDNAAMIAGLAYHRYQKQGKGDTLDLEPYPRVSFTLEI